MIDRRHPRVPLKVEVEYRTTTAFLVAYSVNLSTGGVFLETEEPIPPGTPISLRFVLPGFMPTIEGEVAWVRRPDEGPPGVGVRFFEPACHQLGTVIDALAPGFRGLRVLVFAATPASRGQVARLLRSILSSSVVVEASSRQQAQEELAPDRDLAIVDLDDALSEGLDVIRLARQHAGGSIPVVALASDERQRLRAQALGVDQVINRPPAFAEFQAAVISVLAKPTRVA